jgi:DNA repair protein RecN (Recombination protein N)
MLESLHIRNFAIIEDLVVPFEPGLNILTGETGAGKSILIGAIELLLGGKGATDQIRQGGDEAVVEGLFDLSGREEEQRILRQRGIEANDQVILKRVVSRGGKSRAYVNGQFCTLQMLSEFGRKWVNIYGQHEHQSLLEPDRHLDLLDEYGGLGDLRGRWDGLWKEWGDLNNEISQAQARMREAESRRDLWEFQRREIESAGLQPEEEGAIEQERQVLLHAERLRDGLQRAEGTLYSESGSALERIQSALREMDDLARVDPRLTAVSEAMGNAAAHLDEAIHQVREHLRRVASDPERLQLLEERLEEIRRLSQKYRGKVPEILALAQDLRSRLAELDEGGEVIETLQRKRVAMEGEILALGRSLSEARSQAARALSAGVEAELRDLGADRPIFRAEIQPLGEGAGLSAGNVTAGPRGMDSAEFMLSMNVGEAPRPLWRIASGGELSRIMLALKKVLADAERVPTLVFDEIDAGIGGAVAEALGEKLAHISSGHQVLCVTHLPQVACYARHHLKVRKDVRHGRTVAGVESLGDRDRVEELSRMLGGKTISERARAHAREMLGRSR